MRRWLRYEGTGDEARAEKAFARALGGLPAEPVPPGFADRVLAAAGIVARRRRRLPEWVFQGAFAVWLLSSLMVAVQAAGFARDVAASGQALGLGTRALVGLSRVLVEAATAAGGLLRAGEALSVALSGPSVLLLALACGLASLTALGALRPLMTPERSRHVES